MVALWRMSLFVLFGCAALYVALLLAPDAPLSSSSSSELQLTLGPTDPVMTQKRRRFVQWLRKVGAASAKMDWRQEGVAGSGLFAREDMDGMIGSIPQSATLCSATLEPLGWVTRTAASRLLDEEVLSSYLLYEKVVGKFSGPWGPYLEALPETVPWAACAWSDDDLAYAERHVPLLHAALVQYMDVIEDAFGRVSQFVAANPDVWGTRFTISRADYCWAHAMVMSRWFSVVRDVTELEVLIASGKLKLALRNEDGHAVAHHPLLDNVNSTHHLVPLLDLANHVMVPDPQRAGYVTAVAEWAADDSGRFVMTLTPHGAVKAGNEVFVSYGAKEPASMIVYYGFLPGVPDDFVEAAIELAPHPSDPLYLLKRTAMAVCWPLDHPQFVRVQARFLPLDVFSRAQIVVETRESVLKNHTLVREVFCRSSGVFSQRDIESLRRNKRALLRVSDEIRAALARIPPASQDAAERANVSDNRRVVIDYRAIKRRNLKTALQTFLQGNYRLVKDIHHNGL